MNILPGLKEITLDEIILFVLLGVFLVSIIVLIIMFVCGRKGSGILRHHIKKHDYSVRIYSLNYSECIVRYFDRKNIGKKYTQSLESFYEQFPNPDVTNVRIWLNNHINKVERTGDYLETRVYINKSKEVAFALYEITSINRDKKVIHFESHLLPYLAYENKHKHRNKNLRNYIKTLDEVKGFDDRRKEHNKGGVLLVKLFSVHSYDIDENLMSPIVIQLVNYLAAILNEDRFLVMLNHTEVVIYDSEMNSRNAISGLASKIKQITDSYLSINSLNESYKITIGMALRHDENGIDLQTLVGRSREMAIYAEQKEEMGFELFDSKKDYASLISSAAYTDLVATIRNKTLRYYFTPVINGLNQKVIAYDVSVVPYGSNYETFADLCESASELGLLIPIFKVISSSIIELAKNNKNKKFNLFLGTDMHYYFDYVELIHQFDESNVNLVFVFFEESLSNYDDEFDDLQEKLYGIKNEGVQLGLKIEDETPLLDDEILYSFDHFIINEDLTRGLTNDERKIVLIRTFIDRYSKYEGDIIALNFDSLADLEIAMRIGIKLFSCQAIADASSTFEKLNEDQKEKLVSLTENS